MIDKIYITYMCAVFAIAWVMAVDGAYDDMALKFLLLFCLPATAIYGLLKVWL